MTISNLTEEARRYIENARTILTNKVENEGGFYQDGKYLWRVILYSGSVRYHYCQREKRVERYQRNIEDGKLKILFNTAYDTLHLVMGYDRNLSVKIAQEGLSLSERIVGYVETRLTK
jgi:hypothetical protein